MSDLDDKLAAALNADPPPERDAKFRVEVLLRIERARFQRRVIRTLAVAFVAAVLVAINAQAIAGWIETDIWRFSIIAVGAVVATVALSGVPVEALPVFRTLARAFGRWR
jgi:hypothetical protein